MKGVLKQLEAVLAKLAKPAGVKSLDAGNPTIAVRISSIAPAGCRRANLNCIAAGRKGQIIIGMRIAVREERSLATTDRARQQPTARERRYPASGDVRQRFWLYLLPAS